MKHKLTSAGLSVPLCSCVMAHWNSDAQADQRWLICASVHMSWLMGQMHGLTSAGLSVPLCSYVMAHWNSDAQADQRWLICAFVFMCHGSLEQ